MANDLFDYSTPIFTRHLRILDDIVAIAERHATDHNIDAGALIFGRLYPDMFPFTGQVRAACGTAQRATARLLGLEPPDAVENDATFEAIHEHIRKVVVFVSGFTEADFDGADKRTVAFPAANGTIPLTARDYLTKFALPNFYFHIATAYDILRHNGVPLGKRDYLRIGSEP
jgi:uncharacterized protein